MLFLKNPSIPGKSLFFSEQSGKANDQGITMKGFSLFMKEFIKSYAEINSKNPNAYSSFIDKIAGGFIFSGKLLAKLF
jgi:hypothetical protein